MADKCVVRNAQYRRGGLGIRERHNERKNDGYQNEDIIKEREEYNVHFKQADGGYENTFDRLLADGVISTRGLGQDPFIVDELVFDVNTAHFENNGGYEYARSFFEEAYRCALEEIGGKEYVLSAVMHADERNRALSDQLGRDVYHYHLHVVYIPVVDKEIYFKKNNKDPELAGKLKEVIKQVSHSKKWPKRKQLDENGEVKRNGKGKAILVNAYSLLQDHFHDHMKEAGFIGFERGERGSTAEHLSVVEYKTQQETERAAAMTAVVEQKQEAAVALDAEIEDKEKTVAVLDVRAEKQQRRLDGLDEKISVKDKARATLAEIDAMGTSILGVATMPADDMKKLKTLAKKGVTVEDNTRELKRQLKAKEDELVEVKTELAAEVKKRPSITGYLNLWDKFIAAMKRAPKRLMAAIDEILREPPERQEPQRTAPQRSRSQSQSIEH